MHGRIQLIRNEQGHNIANKIACAPSKEDTHQPADLRCLLEDALDPSLPTECSAKTDENVRMRRLIADFARHTCSLVENAVRPI